MTAWDRSGLVILTDDEGEPLCRPPDSCCACRLFTVQRPDESRAEWLARITADLRPAVRAS